MIKDKSIAILGGGISGLSLAYYLKKKSKELDVHLFDGRAKLGGVLDSLSTPFFFEKGPRVFRADNSEALMNLMIDLELDQDIIFSSAASSKRYLIEDHKLISMPSSLADLLQSPFLGSVFRAVLRDLFARRKQGDESVYRCIQRRFGSEIAERFVDPFLNGHYAGSIHELSAEETLFSLKDLEKKYRSITLGMLLKQRLRKDPRLFTLKEGMCTLIKTLITKIDSHIHSDTKVTSLKRKNHQVEVFSHDKAWLFDHVISTLPAHQLADLVPMPLSDELKHIQYASMNVAQVAYNQKMPIAKGLGALIASREGVDALGMMFDSEIFPEQNKTPQETRLSIFLGGAEKPHIAKATEARLKSTCEELMHQVFGITRPMSYFHVERYPSAIAQFKVGHDSRKKLILEKVNQIGYPLTIAGSFMHRQSINGCIENALTIANSFK